MTAKERDGQLVDELQQLAADIDWPPTPDLAQPVGARLLGEPSMSARLRRPARRGLLLGLLAALLAVGVVGGIGFALGRLQITFSDRAPGSPLPAEVVLERGLGSPTDLETARAALGGTLLLPGDPALGAPDHRFLDAASGAVALAWGERDGLPADPRSGLSVVITEFRADIGPSTFVKVINEDALLDRVSVDGAGGYWVAGGEHFFFFRGPDGQPLETTLRLVGTTLMWERDGLTLRIEGAPSLADALRIAESMRPG